MSSYDKNETNDLNDILINRQGTEFIRTSRVTNKENGEVSYDVRRWYIDDNGNEKPTSKGIRLKKEKMEDVIKVIKEHIGLDVSEFKEDEDFDAATDTPKTLISSSKLGADTLRVDVVLDKNGENKYAFDVRRWYEDEDGELKPSKKGIRLSSEVAEGVVSLIEADIAEL